jgi:signal transduction histidine kinase
VPSRWRIRHKLLLGVALVVAVMALLLLGTLRGLWSYYVTTNTIRAKLHELSAAEELKAAVTELVRPENVTRLLEEPERLRGAVRKVEAALDDYSEQLDDTLANGRDPNHGLYEKAQIECLRKHLADFRQAAEGRRLPAMLHNGGDPKKREKDLEALADPRHKLELDAVDLRNAIKGQLNERLSESRRHYQIALWIIVPSSVVGLLIMTGLMRSFYAWVFHPIRDLELGVKSLSEGRFDRVLSVESGDEMQDLAVAFNDMSRRLGELYASLEAQVNERSRQLVRSERLASVGFLAAGVAHEINNPLASIAFCSEALEGRLADLEQISRDDPHLAAEIEIFGKYLRMIQEEAFRCKSITERLLEFSRTGEPRREPTELRGLVQAVLDVTQHLPNHRGKRIVFSVPSDAAGRVTAWVNGEEIKSVILNLVVNALESMDEDGTLTIRLGQRDGCAELRFIDTGCGMTPEVLENVFEPFFTRSRSGKGTGLGLTISHLIISQHGGAIEANSAGAGRGSTFTVSLPVQPKEPAAEATAGGRAAAPQARLAA